MKFKTQNIRILGNHGFNLHRDGNVTYKSDQAGKAQGSGVYDVVTHESVAAAKALLGTYSCAGSH